MLVYVKGITESDIVINGDFNVYKDKNFFSNNKFIASVLLSLSCVGGESVWGKILIFGGICQDQILGSIVRLHLIGRTVAVIDILFPMFGS